MLSKIDDIKVKLGVRDSEELLGFDKPPDYQCPVIDGILRELNYANTAIHNSKRYDEIDDIMYCIGDVENSLYNLDYDLEDLREAIINIRGWGESWKKLAKSLLEDRDDLVEYFDLEDDE